MKRISLLAYLLAAGLASCSDPQEQVKEQEYAQIPDKASQLEAEVQKQAGIFFKALPLQAESSDNTLTQEKIRLGKILYFDKRLSKNNDVSCNSCHNLKTFGVDNLSVSPGHKGQTGNRNSPTVFNAAFHSSQFWDGRAKTIEEQAGMPILNPVEMAIPDKEFLVKKLAAIELYQNLFASAFPGEAKPVSYSNIEKAIGAFERTLVTPSRFDEYLNGKSDALTSDEKKGLKTYLDAGCATCHSGPALGGNMFQKFGLYGDYWTLTNSKGQDKGRFEHTGNAGDEFMFKVPSLRNIEKTAPYFHDGSVQDLGEAIKIMAKLNLNKDLTDQEVKSIMAFLKTLTSDIPEDVKQEPKELAQVK